VILHNNVSHTPMEQLWCVPPHQTDGQVIQTVLNWIDTNQNDYQQTLKQYPGVGGAYTTITKALVERYQCKR
jgi:hypothetical protein